MEKSKFPESVCKDEDWDSDTVYLSLIHILDVYKRQDDISLNPGQIRIRKKGSAGGHNGIKNIIAQLGTCLLYTSYNDSKGTNPDAAIKAIQAMRRPTILLGGGYDKEDRKSVV